MALPLWSEISQKVLHAMDSKDQNIPYCPGSDRIPFEPHPLRHSPPLSATPSQPCEALRTSGGSVVNQLERSGDGGPILLYQYCEWTGILIKWSGSPAILP